MKLTAKQKEVILAMRKKENVLKWDGVPMCRFLFNGKTLRFDTGTGLQGKNIIKDGDSVRGGSRYLTLTELGKTIKL